MLPQVVNVVGWALLDSIQNHSPGAFQVVLAETVTRIGCPDFPVLVAMLVERDIELQLLEITAAAAGVQPGFLGPAGMPRAHCINIHVPIVAATLCLYHDVVSLIPALTTQAALQIAGVT